MSLGDVGQSFRCAIYTRKSTDEGIHKEFTSLEAQRETCSAYIKSQRHRGWVELPECYDDGGYSGGTLDRPALQRLLTDIEAARVDVVVIYKIDRLSRSLLDFVRLIDMLERYGVSFVSITQAFDTSDSMGRLILNVLLTFAQFEREMTADRLRDKMAAMKRLGKWTGGRVPYGYNKVGKRLVVDEQEAAIIRRIYDEYPLARSGNQLLKRLHAEGIRNKLRETCRGRMEGGNLINPATLHRVLTNPLYLGKIEQQGEWFEGEHEPIVTQAQWDLVQRTRASRHECRTPRQPTGSLLVGILHDAHGRRMSADVVQRDGKEFRYYATELSREGQRQKLKVLRTGADDVERLAVAGLRTFLCQRPAVTDAMTQLGLFDAQVNRAIRGGPRVAARIGKMDAISLRHLFQAIFARAELDREKLRLMVRCTELARLLDWDGVGIFRMGAQVPARTANRVHVIDLPAAIVREDRRLLLPLAPAVPERSFPADPRLLKLLEEARQAQALVYANRDKSVREIARDRRCGPTHLARLIKLNYLAPDIVAAIIDGRQPAGLTRNALLKASIPLDWAQQRMLLGFEPIPAVGHTLSRTFRNHAPRSGGLVAL
jgi:DNA invertase Pin-like site-specific DNA recombinase